MANLSQKAFTILFHMQLWPKNESLKTHELLFYVFLIILPFQTKILYNPSSAYIDWHFNYSLAFFVYLSDMVLLTCFIAWFLFDPPKIDKNRLLGFSTIFLGLILVSLFHVKRLDLGLYQTIKWLELLLLGAYIWINVKNIAQTKLMVFLLFIGGVIQAIVGLVQFHMQHMVGLTLLGEYIAPLGTPGLATITTSGGKIIRAYGTMPHPNVLGAFLVLGLSLGLYLVACETAYRVQGTGSRIKQVLYILGTIVIMLGLFVTFSRLAWVGGALVLLSFFLRYFRAKQWSTVIVIVMVSLVASATIGLGYSDALKTRVASLDQTSISDRKFFSSLGLDLARHYTILGVGVGNYVPALLERQQLAPWQYQPPHNIFIFLAAELGILTTFLFAIILLEIFSKSWFALRESFGFAILTGGVVFLLMAQFDHYFATIQQGRLMFFTLLGLIAALPNLYAQKSN